MAGSLTRRNFLAAGAGLLAARPTFSQPQPRREPFAVTLRKQPPHESLRPLIPPGSDAFACESRAVDLLAILNGSPQLSEDFEGSSPMPTGWNQIAPDAALAQFGTEPFAPGFAAWRAARRDLQLYPLEDGLIRFEASSSDGAHYHVGRWRVAWNDSKLQSFQPLEETRARHQGTFQPVAIIDPDDPAARQLAVGVPDWRRSIDLAAGIDIYGQNGIAVGDIDDDGADEIYVCQPGGLPNRLLQRGDGGVFHDISAASGVDLLDHTSCALFVDFRNSGRQDLVVLTGSGPLLFENDGKGRFTHRPDVFRFAHPPQGSFTGMAAADYDGDGFVDLYLATYIYFQSEDQYSYPSPYHDARNGPPNFLFRNRLAEGYFEDVTAQTGLDQNNDRYSFAPAWCDYDFDGRPELYVANDFGRNNLYKFDGERFRDIAAEAGVEDIGPGMSAAWFDAHSTGRPDLYVTNMWSPAGRRVTHDPAFSLVTSDGLAAVYDRHTKGNTLYRNRGDGSFEETGHAEVGRWAWAGDAFDFDADGVPEIVVAAGMISEPDRSKPDLMSFFWRQTVAHSSADGAPAPRYEEGWNAINQFIREGYSWNGHEPNLFYKRRGDRWLDFSPALGAQPRDTRAFAAVDLSGDGRLDLLLKNRLGPQVQALRNVTPGASVIVLDLEGKQSNRDAIGAWVTAETAGQVTSQLLAAGSGFLCQHTKSVHLGLGHATAAERVTVRWPGGQAEQLGPLKAGKRYRVVEGQGVTQTAPLAAPTTDAAGDPQPPPPVADSWLLEPVPAPEDLPGPGLVLLTDGAANRPDAAVIDLAQSPDRAAWYALFQRYLFDYRGPLVLPFGLLVDDRSRVHKVYREAPPAAVVAQDLQAMRQPDRASLALPFSGRYANGAPRRAYFRHGAAFYQAGYPEQATPYFTAVLEREPQNFQAQLALGQIHLDAQRASQARPFVEAAVRLKPDSPQAWNNYGGLAMLEGDHRAASERFQKALELAPDSTYALANAAQAAARADRAAEAEQLYRRLLEQAPDDADAANELGLLYAKQDRFAEAKRYFQQAIERRRDHVSAINNMAVLYLRQNQPQEAIAALRYGIRVAPANEESYMNLARVYVQSGDHGQARAVLEQLLAAAPESDAARRALGELDRR